MTPLVFFKIPRRDPDTGRFLQEKASVTREGNAVVFRVGDSDFHLTPADAKHLATFINYFACLPPKDPNGFAV